LVSFELREVGFNRGQGFGGGLVDGFFVGHFRRSIVWRFDGVKLHPA
jgi:hypothetical protein